MKKSLLNLSVLAIMASTSSAALASDVTGLTNFTAGTPAVAAEVNGNFTAVKTAVDDNNANITTNAGNISTNTTHSTGDGSDHADVAANTTHSTGNGSDHANVAANTVHSTGNGSDHADVAANTTHSTGDGSDHADVAANTTHSTGNGSDHANVATNTTDIAALQQNGNATGVACAGNDANDIMVRVGPLCVDKYEASVWTTADGPASGGSQLGNGSDNYNTKCDDTANGCTGTNAIFARSEASVNPSTNITWFQAQQACAASGKRLLTNAEWQMAAAGTTDPGATGLGVNECNISSGAVTPTGNSGANCESNWGAADMVGNVWEWVADWVQGNTSAPYTPSTGTAGGSYGNDVQSGTNPAATDTGGATNMMSALYRGGRYSGGANAGVFSIVATGSPAFSDPSIGFRCAR